MVHIALPSAAELAESIRQLVPDVGLGEYLAAAATRSLVQTAEVDEVIASKRRLVRMALPPDHYQRSEQDQNDLLKLAEYRDGNIVKLQRHQLALDRSVRQAIRLARDVELEARRTGNQPPLPRLPRQLSSPAKCRAYLVAWRQQTAPECTKCGCVDSYALSCREIRECPRCHRQWSVREGTILANSHVPLIDLFWAIQVVLHRPSILISDLAEHLGGLRIETARKLKKKIIRARSSADRCHLLAGLDAVFAAAPVRGAHVDLTVRATSQNQNTEPKV